MATFELIDKRLVSFLFPCAEHKYILIYIDGNGPHDPGRLSAYLPNATAMCYTFALILLLWRSDTL